LSLKIFYPDAISSNEIDDYNRVGSLWNEIWRDPRRGLDAPPAGPPESFARQSEILVLYCDGEPIAACCHRYIDLRHECVLYDAGVTPAIWPAGVQAMVPGPGQTCLLGSHIYIHPEFRMGRTGLPIQDIVRALSMAHASGTRPDVVLGAARLDDAAHEGGAISLHANASWCHVPADLIALFPNRRPIEVDAHYREIVETIGNTCDRFALNYRERHRPRCDENH
jgi:hypothetical protein